jgi:maltose O-acetyltransferase
MAGWEKEAPVTEREKMLAGELYLAADPELVAARQRARRLTRLYNATTEEEAEERDRLLRELLGAVGTGAFIEPPFHCDYGSEIFAGERFYANFGCVILDCAPVRIGNDVQLGPSVQIYAATHPLDAAARAAGPELAAPVTLGDRVWIGGGAILCPGVTVGENTTIGAGSVVTRDLPANVLAAGNPCRVIRTLK